MGKTISATVGIGVGIIILILAVLISETPMAQNLSQDEGQTMSEAQKLLAEADAVFKSYKYVESREIYEKALSAAEKDGHNSDITEARSMIARTYLTQDDRETATLLLDKAEKTADSSEPMGWSRYRSVLGRLWWQEKKLTEATELFEELYGYCSQRKMYDRAIDAAHMVAITGTPGQQIEWGKKGIAEAEAGNVSGWLGPLWNNLGATYEDQKEYGKALEAYTKAREYHWQYGNEFNKMVADWAVGHTHRLLKDYEQALTWLKPVLAWCEKLKENEFIGLTCRELGEVDYAEGRYGTAEEYFVRAEKLLKEAGMAGWDPDGFEMIKKRISQLRQKK